MKYLYTICGIKVLFQLPFSVNVQTESENFIQEVRDKECADLYMIFHGVDRLAFISGSGHWEIDRYYVEYEEKRYIYRCPVKGQEPYVCVIWPVSSGTNIVCNYVKGTESYLNYSHNLCDLLGLEQFLLKFGGLLLHASFIRWKGHGLLFTGPSGIGKTTQADLWVEYENAEILNGDRAGIRRESSGWTAYGLPLAGSSQIYKNEGAPIIAIVVLKQGPGNVIRRITSAEAFRSLYPEVSTHQWDKYYIEQLTEILLDMIKEVPVFLLECKPDDTAVQILKNQIKPLREAD